MSAVSPLCVMAKSTVLRSHRRIAVAELAGVFDFDRNAGELLDQVLADQGRVPAGAAGGEDDAVDPAQLLRREVQAAEVRRWRRRGRAGRAWRLSTVSGCSKISLSM